MITYPLKQSGVSAIGSERRLFFWARLRFTLLSLAVVFVVAGVFSGYVYRSVMSDVSDLGTHVSPSSAYSDTDVMQQYVSGTTSSLLSSLVYADLALLTCVMLASYYVSGLILRPVERANRAQRLFAMNASHELRTPLTIMRSDTERLARVAYRQPKDAQEVAFSNLEEIARMQHIIESLLMLVRLESGVVNSGPVQVDAVVRGELEPFKKLARLQQITLSYQSDPELMARAVPQIGSAIRNLVQNAYAHTQGGRVKVSVRRHGSKALIEVKDNGSGIAPESMPHIFEPFYKSDRSIGSGLGLALVKEIVEQSGGTIHMESRLGKGTTAIISLPTIDIASPNPSTA